MCKKTCLLLALFFSLILIGQGCADQPQQKQDKSKGTQQEKRQVQKQKSDSSDKSVKVCNKYANACGGDFQDRVKKGCETMKSGAQMNDCMPEFRKYMNCKSKTECKGDEKAGGPCSEEFNTYKKCMP